jgi:enoyl-CoA hydratase
MTIRTTTTNDGVAVVTQANPPVNSMDAASLEELAATFDRLAADTQVRAVVLTGEGATLSAGLNLKTVPHLDMAGQRRLIAALNDSFGTLYAFPKPLIAAVNGHAIAGGMIVALAADWRVVADVKLTASLAEIRVGVTFPVAAMEIARSELAPSAARRLILLGEDLDAREAVTLRVFDECVPASELMAHAQAAALRFAKLPPNAFATTKRELRSAALAHIADARRGLEPRYSLWLGEEMKQAAQAALLGRAA